MKLKKYFIIVFSFLIQLSFSQNSDESKYEEAKEAYYSENYEEANSLIKEVKKSYKSIPPKVAYLEILIKNKIIELDPYKDFSLIDDTRKLVKIYKNKYVKIQNEKYQEIIQIGESLNQYPKDLNSFNEIKEQKQKELALEKEQLEKKALELKQKAEADRIKKIEEDRINRIVTDRKNKLRPYTNPAMFSEYELARFSESEFNEKLEKAIQESIIKKEEEKIAKEIENQRLAKLQPYIIYVNSNDKYNIGTYSEERFEEIFEKAKADFKAAEKRNKPQLGSFSSFGFQSGEIAKYGFIYESGGRKTVGFRFTGRTTLASEEEILNGTIVENKTEIELGPNFKLFNRIYFNIGVGYGYYDRLINNDYAGELFIEKTGYTVATTGLMFRLSRIISINGGASFMDIDKDFYKPEITFGISFNLKGKYKY